MLDIWGIILTALLSALVGAVGGGGALNKSAAKKSEVDYLRGIIGEFRTERDCDRIEIQALESKVNDLENKLEAERKKRRDLEDVVTAKDTRISDLEHKVASLESQLEALEQTPVTKRNGKKPPTGPLPQPVK